MSRLIALASLTLLAACGGSSAPERYQLTPAYLEEACQPHHSIKILEPNPAPELDNGKIVVIDRPNHVTHYEGVAWSGSAAQTIQHALAEGFEKSGNFSSVSTDVDALPATYELHSDLRDYQVDLTGEERVVISITFTLTRSGSERVIRTIRIEREAPIDGANIDEIVAIFDEQMHSISEELFDRLRPIFGCRH